MADQQKAIKERRMHEFLGQKLIIYLLHFNELPLKIVAHRQISLLVDLQEFQPNEHLDGRHQYCTTQGHD